MHHMVVERDHHQRGIRDNAAQLARIEGPVLHRLPLTQRPKTAHRIVGGQRGQTRCRDCHRASFIQPSFLYTFPPFMTNTTRRTALISSSGFPSVAMMSASMLRAIDPIWSCI